MTKIRATIIICCTLLIALDIIYLQSEVLLGAFIIILMIVIGDCLMGNVEEKE